MIMIIGIWVEQKTVRTKAISYNNKNKRKTKNNSQTHMLILIGHVLNCINVNQWDNCHLALWTVCSGLTFDIVAGWLHAAAARVCRCAFLCLCVY